MDASRSPFVEKPVTCPACGQASPQRFIRSRVFAPGERESDQHVLNYRWLDSAYSPIHPPYYFLFHCPHCYFTDISEDFLEPSNSPFSKRLFKVLSEIPDRERLLVELLRRHVNYADIDFGSALNLHFIALIQQQLPPRDLQDSYKIARLQLRAAWLYREQTSQLEGTRKLPVVEDIMTAAKEFDLAIFRLKEKCDSLVQAIGQRINEQENEIPEKTENPYRAIQTGLTRVVESGFRESHKLKETCKRDRAGTLFAAADAEAKPFFAFPTYQAFLDKLKDLWPLAPADEIEAMRGAVQNFERAISTDPRLEDSKSHHGVLSLIVDLMVRSDDLNGAFTMVRSLFKADSDNRQRLQKELQNKEIDEHQKNRIRNEIERANVSIQQIGELRHGLMDQIVQRDKAKIQGIVEQNAESTAEEIDKALEASGVPADIIARLRDKGGMLEFAGKKKSRFF